MDGIVTVLNTPFTDLDDVDTLSLQQNAAIALDAGVAGFLVGGLAGEVAYLSPDERIRILAATREVAGDRVPVIGGAFGASQAERLSMARKLTAAGCDGIMASVPYSTPEQFASNIRELANVGGGFLMVQDWDPHGSGIPIPVILDLFDTVPNFTWLKVEVIPAGPKYSEVLESTGGNLKVAGGWAVNEMIDALDRGVSAIMPTGMHYIYTTLHRLHLSGHRDQAIALFEELKPVLSVSNQSLEISIHFFKRLLYTQGLYATAHCRCPQPTVSQEQAGRIDHAIQTAIELDARLTTQSS